MDGQFYSFVIQNNIRVTFARNVGLRSWLPECLMSGEALPGAHLPAGCASLLCHSLLPSWRGWVLPVKSLDTDDPSPNSCLYSQKFAVSTLGAPHLTGPGTPSLSSGFLFSSSSPSAEPAGVENASGSLSPNPVTQDCGCLATWGTVPQTSSPNQSVRAWSRLCCPLAPAHPSQMSGSIDRTTGVSQHPQVSRVPTCVESKSHPPAMGTRPEPASRQQPHPPSRPSAFKDKQ